MALSGKKFGNALQFTLDNQGGAGAVDISAYVKSVKGLPGEIDQADVTCGTATGYQWLNGLPKAEISLECVFDDAASSAWTITKDFMSDTTTRSFVYGPAGSTSGYAKMSGELRIKKIEVGAVTTEALLFTISTVLDGALTVGTYA